MNTQRKRTFRQVFRNLKRKQGERVHLDLTNKTELSICLATNYLASLDDLPFDYATKFGRIVNPKWATDMYTIYGQHAKVKHYLKSRFMDGYIKKDDYQYITTGYLQFDKTLFDSSDEDSSNEEDYVSYAYAKPRKQWRHAKFCSLFLVRRQFKQFVDIITMNAVHRTNFERAYVLDVHFSKSAIDSDVTAASAKRQRFSKCVVHSWAAVHGEI